MSVSHSEVAAGHHDGPHIVGIQGESIQDFSLFGVDITTTVFSTWIFMIVLFVIIGIFNIAIRTSLFPKIRAFGLDIVRRLDNFITDTVGKKKYARIYFPLLGGFFFFILSANIFGLILDYFNLGFPFLHSYLRPFNSDMATTLAMALAVIFISHIAGMLRKGLVGHWKHYFFNFSGHSFAEKIVNVPIGWIHFLGEFTRILSLSVRLFANIFAGVALIAVMAYLGEMIPFGVGGIIMLPLWMFEVLVAFIQAFIFVMLSSIYIREAVTIDNH